MNPEIERRVKQIVSNVFSIEPHDITENASPETIEKWNSLGHMNLIVALEEEFKIQFSDLQIIEITSLSLIVYAIRENMHGS